MVNVHANNDPVPFDNGTADELARYCRQVKGDLESFRGGMQGPQDTASREFRGNFSRVFADNARQGQADSTELGESLEAIAKAAEDLKAAAAQENQNRAEAREWEERDFWERGGDWLLGHEAPTGGGTAPQMRTVSAHTVERQTPLPGSGGGGGGGTSSARPSDLRGYSSAMASQESALTGTPGTLRGKLADFASLCQWGQLDGESVAAALEKWLGANAEERRWVNTVADAFEAAGSEGKVSTLSDSAVSQALRAQGVSTKRDDIPPAQPGLIGGAPTSGFANDPVNTATGNFIEPETDLEFDGPAQWLSMGRMYNSVDVVTAACGGRCPDAHTAAVPRGVGVFGPGWSSMLDSRVVFTDEGATWVGFDGRETYFPREGSGWGRAEGENYWLAAEQDGTVCLSDHDGGCAVFTSAGVMVRVGRGAGSVVSLQRDPSGRVVRVSHEFGRFFDVEYRDDRVVAVLASDGRRVEYLYNESGHLVAVETEAGRREYVLDEQHLISQVISAAGVVEVTNTYDQHGRVTAQVSEHGRKVRYAYLPGRVTVVSNPDGTLSNQWIADTKGRLVGMVDGDGHRQSMAYDRHGNLVSVTERDGKVTVNGYDARGRLVRTVTPEGGDITYGYDAQDRVTTVVLESGATVLSEYADDASRNPCAVTDPMGGRTELVWEHGLLVEAVDPTGVRVRMGYDAHGQLTSMTNAAGSVLTLTRDGVGRLTSMVMPSGATTVMTYDAAGNMVSRRDPDGAVTTFEYAAGHRLVATTAPDGGRTTVEYTPGGNIALVVDPLGRAARQVFDEIGQLTQVADAAGSLWSFGYDPVGRQTLMTDPNGGAWAREFMANGELAAVTDPTGVRQTYSHDRVSGVARLRGAVGTTTVRFDKYQRPVAVEAEDGSAELVTYDAAGRPVELVDGEGGLTLLERDAAGRVIAETFPAGRVTRFEYDECGRPCAQVDAAGLRTEVTYDADSRVAARHLPDGTAETVTYDACGRVTKVVTPGVGVARYGYDVCGRINFVADGKFGTRRFGYDQAGQLVKATNGVGGATGYHYDEAGNLVTIVDPTGGVTRRSYDALGNLLSTQDPAGRITRFSYDGAGRMLSRMQATGDVVSWSYQDGTLASVATNGRVAARFSHDVAARNLVVEDHTRALVPGQGAACAAATHEFVWDRCGRMISRTRNGEGLTWAYDPDGLVTERTGPRGEVTGYRYDGAGRLVELVSPGAGSFTYVYDAFGRAVSVSTQDSCTWWGYRDGFVSQAETVPTGSDELSNAGASGDSVVGYQRDEWGKITSITTTEGVLRLAYDGAGQLVSAVGEDGPGWSWVYDAGGRLVEERADEVSRVFAYDVSGALLSVTTTGTDSVSFSYDAAGRRAGMGSGDLWVSYEWSGLGWLSKVTQWANGRVTGSTDLWVDGVGELAAVDGCPVWWDSAVDLPQLLSVGDAQVSPAVGGGVFLDEWALPAGGGDLWGLGATGLLGDRAADAVAGGVSLGVTSSGVLSLGGLLWQGARVYDPGARGFLSRDPLDAVVGAGYGGAPYSFAGNDPVNLGDPLGLSPMSETEMVQHQQAHPSTLGGWVKKGWEYAKENPWKVIGGAAMVVGVAALFVVPGGPIVAGMVAGALISGGSSMMTNSDGCSLDTKKVLVDTAVGAGTGALGGGALKFSSKVMAGTTATKGQIAKAFGLNAGVQGAASGTGSGLYYATDNNWQIDDWGDFRNAVVGGTVTGGLGSFMGPAGGSMAKGVKDSGLANRVNSRIPSKIASRLNFNANGNVATGLTGIGNVAVGGTGSMVADIATGREIDYDKARLASLSAGTSFGLGKLSENIPGVSPLVTQKGTDTLKQVPHWAPRSQKGAMNFRARNTYSMIGSANQGAIIGFGVDLGTDGDG